MYHAHSPCRLAHPLCVHNDSFVPANEERAYSNKVTIKIYLPLSLPPLPLPPLFPLCLRASPTSQCMDYVRISFSYYEVDVLVSAISKMADLINSMLQHK